MTPVIDTTRITDGEHPVRRRSRTLAIDTVPVTGAVQRAPAPRDPMTATPLSHLIFATAHADARSFTHGLRRVAREAGTAEGFVAVASMSTPGAVVRHDDSQDEVSAGALVLWDAERPPVIESSGQAGMRACLVPRRTLAGGNSHLKQVAATVIDGDSPVAALVEPHLVALAETASGYSERVASWLAWSFTDLVATLVTERFAGDGAGRPYGSGYSRTADIYAYVDQHLGDPELGPARIAAAHNMSLRALHKLFEGEGITVHRLIQRRRLQECAKALARGDNPGMTIAGVARRWGFVNSAHFSRAFRAAYGMTPSEWRSTRGGSVPSDRPGDVRRTRL
ncbi:helix-turn-helix domain-containing protein [Streptomyces lavenduligriseus]|uniref:Helix-turn-helix domain-containing protein n=1 Tax=Streptomyces lavenduligriseus TaxID=67315 RepID=A0ABT0NTC5_9ACTN|nr:helix-turn-helix domain-containing protein [Streptomyces lavenduligriseus]MCL3994729.1 helix-turn-helix domain-containing protein [Streptomyces lavenduligriseus]